MPREITLTRTFDAPRHLVWQAWTEPEHFAQWWGPKGYTNPVCELNVHPGGSLLIHMTSPEGVVILITGTFEEVVERERLVFITANFPDEHGDPQFMVRNTVTFMEEGSKTKLIMHALILKSAPQFESSIATMDVGWNESLDRLEQVVATL